MPDKKTTDEFLNEILSSDQIGALVDGQDEGTWNELDLVGCLDALLAEKHMTRAQVINAAGLTEAFGYQVFKGQRGASRNTLLQLAFGFGASLKETNHLLHAGNASELYARSKRDTIIIFCLNKGYSLMAVDEELYRRSMETICNADG